MPAFSGSFSGTIRAQRLICNGSRLPTRQKPKSGQALGSGQGGHQPDNTEWTLEERGVDEERLYLSYSRPKRVMG